MRKFIAIVTSVIMLSSMLVVPAAAANADVETESASCVISSTTYTAEDSNAVVPFDYDSTFSELYSHVRENNAGLSDQKVSEIAQELTNNIATIEANLQSENYSTISANTSQNAQVIIPLGRVINGELSQLSTYTPILDSKTSIISSAWSVNPHLTKHTKMCNYAVIWDGLDLYKSAISGTYTQTITRKVSNSVGFKNTYELSASECAKFGLTVTASKVVSSSINKGFTLNVNAWTKMCVRPYIYYYVDNYEGTYRYYCYNALEKEYFYISEKRTAENSYDVERSYRVWTAVNESRNPNATSPVPPTNWVW